jgi:hypothetical protein
MTSISKEELAQVRGGFGALIGALAQAAGPILNGVGNIIGASKAGKGGGGGAPQAAAGGPPPGGAAMAGAVGIGERQIDSGDPAVSITVGIGVPPQRA